LNDPNLFMEKTEYLFLTCGEDWYILEKVSDRHIRRFKDRLMIDKNGIVYSVAETDTAVKRWE